MHMQYIVTITYTHQTTEISRNFMISQWMIYHTKSHLMDQITLETDNLILFNHVIMDFEAIFMNYKDEQVCMVDANDNLKKKEKSSNYGVRILIFLHYTLRIRLGQN